MQRWIMHIDMDAFYASIEQLDNPELKGKPVIVGGGDRGVVSAASYEARRFGVRSAVPIFQARRLCPQGVFVPVRMQRYKEVSRRIMEVLSRFSPLVEQASVDEAYLDASGLDAIFGPVRELGQSVKDAVFGECSLTCSVGLAPVKFLAKIASDMDKPDGLTVLEPQDLPALLAALPVSRIPGVGHKTLELLKNTGVHTCGDVRRYPKEFWQRRLGKAGESLYDRAGGVDPRPVVPFEPPKSESAENTFEVDTLDREVLERWLLRQSERVGASLRRQGLAGRTVTLKAKYADFTQVTRARTLDQPFNGTRLIYETAVALLRELNPKRKLRLIGVGVSHFGGGKEARQLSLFSESEQQDAARSGKDAALDKTLDELRERFGHRAVVRGKLFE